MDTETGIDPCDCDPMFPGAHIDLGEASAPESGELGVERCDACMRYEGDLDAAWAVVQVTGGRVFFYQNQNGVDEETELEEQSEKREFTGTYRDDDCIAYGTDPWIEGGDMSKLGSGGDLSDEERRALLEREKERMANPDYRSTLEDPTGVVEEPLPLTRDEAWVLLQRYFAADGGLSHAEFSSLQAVILRRLADPEAPVRKFLDLATCHLPESIMNGPIGPLNTIEGVIAYEHGEYGYLLWVPDDPQEHADDYPNPADEDVCSDEGVPAEVLAVQLYARSLDCDYVLFDRDADAIEALPTWEW